MRNTTAPIVGATAAALALAVLIVVPGVAGAKTKLVELRVEGDSETLDKGTWYATHGQLVRRGRTPSCKRRRGMDVFRGASALTVLAAAQTTNKALRPVRTRPTDFGPLVCQIGRYRSFGTFPDPFGGPNYYVNYNAAISSADVAKVKTGDSVLWFHQESEGVNSGCVLELADVPARDPDGTFQVRVITHTDGFSPCDPADAGVTIAGADSQSAAGGGFYDVTVGPGSTELYAERDQDVRSNRLTACVGEASECPSAHGRKMIGSNRDDRLPGTRGDDVAKARRGDDRIVISQGGNDVVRCGKGDDVVVKRRGDGRDRIARSCERVVRR